MRSSLTCFSGAVRMASPTTPWSYIGLGSMVVLGRQPRPCTGCSTRLWRTREWCPGLLPPSDKRSRRRYKHPGIASGGRVGNYLANGQKSGRGGSFSRARPSDPTLVVSEGPPARVAVARSFISATGWMATPVRPALVAGKLGVRRGCVGSLETGSPRGPVCSASVSL